MGNNLQNKYSETYGRIFVHFNKDTLYTNEDNTGIIFLEIKQNYPANELILNIEGTEETVLYKKSWKPGKVPAKKKRHDFLDSNIKIHQWEGKMIPPGQYSFPFRFKLPEGLPPTFFYKKNAEYGAISYNLLVYITPEDKEMVSIFHKLNPVIKPGVPHRMKPFVKEMNANLGCCFGNEGKIKLDVHLEKSHFLPGEEIKVGLDIDCLQSKVDILKVELKRQSSRISKFKLIIGYFNLGPNLDFK